MAAREALTPDVLALVEAVARNGSFAGAARELGLVPSAVTYRVRQAEDALDVLLFDRSTRQAHLTEAGAELLREGQRLLQEIDAVANRVRRVANGWESQLTIAVDTVVSTTTMMELACDFTEVAPSTRLRLRDEVLTGTLEAVATGEADLAIGVALDATSSQGIQAAPLGVLPFIFVVAPSHPLATAQEPIGDAVLQKHRAIAVADSVRRGLAMTTGLLPGQDVLTVASMQAKLDAQLRGLGGGWVPEPMARAYIAAGRLVVRQVQRPPRMPRFHYAWRAGTPPGRGLSWWLARLEGPATRQALLEAHPMPQ